MGTTTMTALRTLSLLLVAFAFGTASTVAQTCRYTRKDPLEFKPTPTPVEHKTTNQFSGGLWDMPVAEPKELSPQDCEMIDVDFSTLVPGQYITDELQSKYGLSVSAVALSGGFTPFGAARVFDTANPTSATDRLGSPNGDCGGKSWGNGGKRASPHQNCDPLGNVVLVQAKDSEKVDDNYSPSYLNFDFDEPVHVENIVLMQAYGRKEIIVNVTLDDGEVVTMRPEVMDTNGVFKMPIDKKDVKRIAVYLQRSGAVASLRYTWCASQEESVAPTPSPEDCPVTHLDFSTLAAGAYIRDELKNQFAVKIRAKGYNGGYTPRWGSAMIIDTTNPGPADPDLGTPNVDFGGKGKGAGGGTGATYANKESLGNALIIQASNSAIIDNHEKGGYLHFHFEDPVHLHNFVLLDADGLDATRAIVYKDNGQTHNIYIPSTGDNGVRKVHVDVEGVDELRVYMPEGGAIPSIDYTLCSLAPTPEPTYSPECPYVDLDFSQFQRGDYIKDELWDEFGVTLKADSKNGGYRPSYKARIFDTSNPGTWIDGNPSLGSKNLDCGGPGEGEAGAPGSPYENCEALGNVLIVQDSDRDTIRDHKDWSSITFYFKTPVFLESIKILTGDGCKPVRITPYKHPGKKQQAIYGEEIGPNGVNNMYIGMKEIVKVKVELPKGGAIADIVYTWCPFDTPAPSTAVPTGAPVLTAKPTRRPTISPKPTRAPTVRGPRTERPTVTYISDCPTTHLDFAGLAAGAYITTQLRSEYGVRLYAKSWDGGYVPSGAVRVFDSANPGTYNSGDPDLGSPNSACPGGGPGLGEGGIPGSQFENCDPLGNLIIVQASNKVQPDDHERGSRITFKFDHPTYVDNIVVIDNDGCNCDPVSITLHKDVAGKVKRTGETATGNNGVAKISIDVHRVTKMEVYFPTSGAIASLDYNLCVDT